LGINIEQYSNISKEEFEVEIVTPLFLAGADKDKSEIRPASIKGAIRFWWRALYGHKFASIKEMAKKEDEIFGSTDRKSSFFIMVDKENLKKSKSSEKLHESGFHILNFLAYGYDDNNGKIREFIKENSKFNIILNFYNNSYKKEVLNSFYALIKFGSLGAKARNGFGSLNIINKEVFTEVYYNEKILDFTAFSKFSRLFNTSRRFKTSKQALISIGNSYRAARGEIKNHNLDRALIATPFKNNNDRHSKPYFLHVNKLKSGEYQGQILFLPYNYDENKRSNYNTVHTVMCNVFAKKLEEVKL